jgi:hypothetical protein
MITARRMYADDFADWLPPNPEGGQRRTLWVSGDAGTPLEREKLLVLPGSM